MLIANRADSEYSAMVLSIEGPLEEGSPGPSTSAYRETRLRLRGAVHRRRCLFPALGDPRLSYCRPVRGSSSLAVVPNEEPEHVCVSVAEQRSVLFSQGPKNE